MKAWWARAIAGRPLWQIDAAGAAVVCICVVVWYAAGLRPLSQARGERLQKEQELEVQRTVAQNKARLLVTQEKELAKAKAAFEASEIQVRPVSGINGHVAELQRAAGAAGGAGGVEWGSGGLRVDEIRPGQPVSLARFTMVPIRISGVGDYAAVTAFLSTLRAQFRDTGVTGFILRSRGVESATELGFELDLVWYAEPLASVNEK